MRQVLLALLASTARMGPPVPPAPRVNGQDGATGATGAAGLNGQDGATGATGAAGTNGHAGAAAGYIEHLTFNWAADQALGLGPSGRAIRQGTPQILDDVETEPTFAPWREAARSFGIRSSITVPTVLDGKVVAILGIYASEPNAFGPDELRVLQQLSDEVGLALVMQRSRAQLNVAEAARREAEENLRAATLFGPGLLYRASVFSDHVTVEEVFGDVGRVVRGANVNDADLSAVSRLLSTPNTVAAMRMAEKFERNDSDHAITQDDGSVRWIRNSVRVVSRDADALLVIGYMSDITREKREQLHQQQMSTLVTLGEMSTGIAHELNQPLASIAFASENARMMLERATPDLKYVDDRLARIMKMAHRAGRLIDHMRVFARGGNSRMEPSSWAKALEAAIEILSVKLHEVEVVSDLPADLPLVMGGMIAMEQVLINLISNAVDAYRETRVPGPQAVKVSGAVEQGDVVLRVSDQAGGIPPEVQARVFEPFFTTKPVGKGTGLGLSMTFGTIKEMGGTIDVRNQNGGAVFTIRVPSIPTVAEAQPPI